MAHMGTRDDFQRAAALPDLQTKDNMDLHVAPVYTREMLPYILHTVIYEPRIYIPPSGYGDNLYMCIFENRFPYMVSTHTCYGIYMTVAVTQKTEADTFICNKC